MTWSLFDHTITQNVFVFARHDVEIYTWADMENLLVWVENIDALGNTIGI